MSNLFKQQYVMNLQTEKRIINADERFMMNNPKIVGGNTYKTGEKGENVPGSEEILDGFLAGLVAEEVIIEPQPSPEEILGEARMQAEQIVACAQADAIQIQEQAKKDAEKLFERKKLEGYKEGVSKLQDELLEKTAVLENEFQQNMLMLQAGYEAKLETMETDIVDNLIRVFNKVFHIQFENKRQILLQLIKDAVLGMESGKEFHIRVAESNYKFIESHVSEIKEKLGNDVNIDVVNDITLEDGDCMIETETGVYNCGVDMVLDNLEKDIRSLCR